MSVMELGKEDAKGDVMRVRLFALAAAVVLAVGLIGCSGSGSANSSKSDNPTSVTATAVSSESDDAQEVKMVESGFTKTEYGGTYAVILENTSKTKAAENVKVDITYRDASGKSVGTDSTYVSCIFPLQKVAVTSPYATVTGDVATVEARTGVNKNGWTATDGIQGGDLDSLLNVIDLAATPGDYGNTIIGGEVKNDMGKDLRTTRVDVVYRDEAGAITGGAFTYVDNVPAGSSAAFTIQEMNAVPIATVEAYTVIESME